MAFISLSKDVGYILTSSSTDRLLVGAAELLVARSDEILSCGNFPREDDGKWKKKIRRFPAFMWLP